MAMPVRVATVASRAEIAQSVSARLDSDPAIGLDDLAHELGWCPRSVQRALKDKGTSFRAEQRARRLDRAAQSVLDDGWRQRHSALRRAATAAGFRHSRHLADPFRCRFGVAPSVAWRASSLITDLTYLATAPRPQSRTKQYSSWRRKWPKRRNELRGIAANVVPGTVLARAVDEALAIRRSDFRGRQQGRRTPRRARPRARGRRRR
jgi:AraC-like DNA-binding protein